MMFEVLVTVALGIPAISFAEHAIHRHVMHRKRFPKWIYRLLPDLRDQFHNHAVMHHTNYYEKFDHEPTAEGKYFNLRIHMPDTLRVLLLFLPLILAAGIFVSPVSALTIVVLIVGHNLAWNAAHLQMHVPEGRAWFRDTAYFRMIARHHFMHHQRSAKNYNVVVPLADFLMGTDVGPEPDDVTEMVRLGYLEPQ